MRRAAFNAPDKVAYRDVRRNFYKHVDVFARQDARYDLDAQFFANLADDRPDTLA
jgi:hypothetical protein